jgi:glycosyltransferase involved in cell wall biosynthesis
VHTHSSKAGLVGRAAAVAARVPAVVHTQHGWSIQVQASATTWRAYQVAERVLARASDRLIVVTSLDRDAGLRLGIGRPEQYRVIRSGIDLGQFAGQHRCRARDRLGLPLEAPLVGSVARLAPPKDIETLVRAFAQLMGDRPAARLVLVGDGPRRDDIEALVASLGMEERVVLAGTRRDVAEVLPAFDVLVLSSLHEGLPRAIVEAMASGVPVVATAVGGIPEIVRDEETGLLVPVGDATAMGAAISRLLDDPALGSSLAASARSLVAEFDVGEMVSRTVALYDELIG